MKYARFFVFTLTTTLIIVAAISAGRDVKAASYSWSANAVDQLASNSQNWEGDMAPVSGDAITLPVGSVTTWDLPGIVPSSLVSSADLTLQTPLIISGDLNLAGGSLKLGNQPLNVGGDLTIAGASLDAGGAPINISGNWDFESGTVTMAASTVTMNGATNKTITSGGQYFGNLTIASANGTVGLGDDLSVDGALAVTDGTLNVGEHTVTVMGGLSVSGGTLSVGSGTIVLAGSLGRPLDVSGGVFSAATNSTIEYSPVAGVVSIEPVVYGNLKLTGNNVFSLAGDTTVTGVLTVGLGATLSLGGHTLNVPSGTIANAGNISDGRIVCPASSLLVTDAGGSDLSTIKTSSGTIIVQVDSQDLNRHGTVSESIPAALIITTISGDKESVNIQETAPASGIFTSLPLVVHQGIPIQGNGQIEVSQSDIIFVKYVDPQDPTDTQTVQIAVSLASATSSGAPQIVNGPMISNWSVINTGSGMTYNAHIIWDTDLESASAVTITSAQLTTPITAGSLTGTTEHDVAVSGLVRGADYAYTVTSVTADGQTVTSQAQHFTVITPGDRIKVAGDPAVYWYLNGKRNVFPDLTTYESWFPDFSGIVTVPADQLSDIALGHVVPVRAGTYLVKIQSDPKTYAVEPYGVLRWIPTEAQAIALYGSDWSTRVRDIDVSQFVNYFLGDELGAGEVPSGFVYKLGNNEMNAVIDDTIHPLSEYDRQVNGLFSQFITSVSPSIVSSLGSGGAVNGYDPDLDGVLKDGAVAVVAPAFGT
jgi:hypothetical protein